MVTDPHNINISVLNTGQGQSLSAYHCTCTGHRGEASLFQPLHSNDFLDPTLFHHQMSLQTDSLNLCNSRLYVPVARTL